MCVCVLMWEEPTGTSDPFPASDSTPESFLSGHLFKFIRSSGWEALRRLGLISVSPAPTLHVNENRVGL